MMAKTKGHWPRGKRRNPLRGVTEIRMRLQALASAYGATAKLARELGVSTKQLWRWRTGLDRPSPENVGLLREALRRTRSRN